MSTRSDLVLETALQVLRPLVRLMLRHGVAYPAFALALKRVFLQAAEEELQSRSMPRTDSAVSLLSGVHRRDVRNLSRLAPDVPHKPQGFAGVAAEVVARWLADPQRLDASDQPLPMPKNGGEGSFAALVRQVSSDVRPRAVLDELLRLGIAEEADDSVRLRAGGFAPRQGFGEMAQQLQANVHDHLAASCQNLEGQSNFLEQAVYTDQITAESAQHIAQVAQAQWRQAFKAVMRETQAHYDADAQQVPPAQRTHRMRFGVYYFSTKVKDHEGS